MNTDANKRVQSGMKRDGAAAKTSASPARAKDGAHAPAQETPAATSERKRLRVVLADDHVLMRELLVGMIAQERDCCDVVAQVGTASEAVEVCRELTPDLLVLDGAMPGMSGVDAVPLVKAAAPSTRILLCCGSVNERELLKALQAGADGFMEKTNSRAVFFEAIDRVSRGENYLCTKSISMLSRVLRNTSLAEAAMPQGQATLTAREKEIIGLIAEGLSSKEIATKLFLSLATVETHRSNLMTKIHARNAAQLVRYALDHGLIASK